MTLDRIAYVLAVLVGVGLAVGAFLVPASWGGTLMVSAFTWTFGFVLGRIGVLNDND